ncbi:MAG: NADH-quinone oxidoreductase subunit B family protein [Promethearchaeota archaeon]|jgi:sulfhydrogenase subunit delta
MVKVNNSNTGFPKPKVGIYGFTGCAGDQLLILHTEDEILNLINSVDLRSFTMASSNPIEEELDIAFIEGSITTEEDRERILTIRKRAKILVAIGNCAVNGGPQAMCSGDGRFEERLKKIYGDATFMTNPMESKPIDAYVEVDYYLPGCPISAPQTLSLISRLIHGVNPEPYPHPVCHACKLNENRCLLLDKIECLGPLTAGGCGSACINHGLPCVGCWGPNEDGNFDYQLEFLESFGKTREELLRLIRGYGGHKILKFIKKGEK